MSQQETMTVVAVAAASVLVQKETHGKRRRVRATKRLLVRRRGSGAISWRFPLQDLPTTGNEWTRRPWQKGEVQRRGVLMAKPPEAATFERTKRRRPRRRVWHA